MGGMTKTQHSASWIRKRLLELPKKIAEETKRLVMPRTLFRGSVYHSKRRCGKPSCKCARGDLHDAWVVATTVNGKRTTRSLPQGRRKKAVKLTKAYRGFRQAQTTIRKLHKEMIGLSQELEELLCEDILREEGSS